MSGLRNFLRREWLLAEQRRELAEARGELVKLREQTERMRAGMRRCLTCDYRQKVIGGSVEGKPAGEDDSGAVSANS